MIRGSPLVQSLNIFVLVRVGSPAEHLRVGGNGKSGWNKQEQCMVWIPLYCGVPDAKRANSYSAAMVMTSKTGESPSNGAPPKVDTLLPKGGGGWGGFLHHQSISCHSKPLKLWLSNFVSSCFYLVATI